VTETFFDVPYLVFRRLATIMMTASSPHFLACFLADTWCIIATRERDWQFLPRLASPRLSLTLAAVLVYDNP
jgi:hypothetical protein